MTFGSLFALVDPAWLIGGTGGGGALAFVGAQFHRLSSEVKECRNRDARFVVIEAGFRLVVGEMQRTNPNSAALRLCGDLLNRKLGPAPDISDLTTLLTALDDADATPAKGKSK